MTRNVRIAAVLAATAYAGCDTKGRNIPLEVAKYQPPKPLYGDVVRIAPEPALPWRIVTVDGRQWAPTTTEYALPDRFVRPVGTGDGMRFHALTWDRPPFDRLLVARPAPAWLRDPSAFPTRPGYWLEFLEVY